MVVLGVVESWRVALGGGALQVFISGSFLGNRKGPYLS